MCKYCKVDDFDGGYEYFNDYGGFSKKIKLNSKDYQIELEMIEGNKLSAEVYSLDEHDIRIHSKKVKIKYCPWCGRKLQES